MKFTQEQIFIVTGASSGLGQSVAHLLNKEGATVVAIGRNESRLQEGKGKAIFPTNYHLEIKDLVEDIGNLHKYVTTLKNKYGKFSGLANCAGVSRAMSFQGLQYEDFELTFQTNYFSPIMMAKGFCDKRNNSGKGSSIVSISSIAALTTPIGLLHYSGSKSAIIASMKALSREVASTGIRINTISPGLINTPMLQEGLARGETDVINLANSYPFGMGDTDDVASLAVYLLSNEAKWITGQDYIINYGSV